MLRAGATNYEHASSLVVEARALQDSVYLAIQAGHANIHIEGDNLIVIQTLKENFHIPWKIASIIEDIQSWFQQGIQVTISHIFRETNIVANWLSKFGHSLTDKFIMTSTFPHVLVKLLQMISLNAPCEKRHLISLSLIHI